MSSAYVISNNLELRQLTAGRLIATTDTGRLKVADDLDVKSVLSASLGSPGGIATLDDNGSIPPEQLANISFPNAKGTLIVGDGTSSVDFGAGADGAILRANSATQVGLEWDASGIDHLTDVTNAGTNTHAQLDAFVDSRGQMNGLATLDGTGNVPLTQLGNAPAGYTPPVTKGSITTGDDTNSVVLAVGTNNQVLTVDLTANTGLVYRAVDHANLTNGGTNTHAQLDAFVASSGQPNGLATLDGTGNVPLTQLGNVPAGDTLPITKGVIVTGDGSASVDLLVGADDLVLTADSATSTGLAYKAVDHVNLVNKGTNTHAQIDSTLADHETRIGTAETGILARQLTSEKGQADGYASLDSTGNVPLNQLGNVPAGSALPVTKGVIITGDGTNSVNLSPGTENQVLTVVAADPNGIAYRQVDHVNLANAGTNTHAQLDAFVSSKAQADGLASLDSGGQVPASQLGNVSAVAGAIIVEASFTGAGTFQLWELGGFDAGYSVSGNIHAQVSAMGTSNTGSGNWLLWAPYLSGVLGVIDPTPQIVLANRVAGSFASGSAELVTAENVPEIRLMVTQTADTTWRAIIHSNAARRDAIP
ncbi:hypothetical protein QKT49_gp074 [Acanthamoeba castellanii medusavirus]|uniref:Uncharacterized protein n=1 Tax=Acanthamoeba castellanii medusavirus J1 TaxID=3114988 RepID=A0A3T1CWL6_9VIRU|nr:hypothetical protein QKT49_gp074 [Acanthamoeba castellanii medusavirus]BBI30214.1 hypothetical protein [Acanthamoeba castellanii medusavirus J1]